MYKAFDDIESLCRYVETDKRATGAGAANLDRYPIRFVLFDNFRDNYAFVNFMRSSGRPMHVESVDKWLDRDYPDRIITQKELCDRIREHIAERYPKDCLIAPFSELARFYDNTQKMQFDSLLRTIKGFEAQFRDYEASSDGEERHHQRVYIPIVGLEGKMDPFKEDSQINIWQLKSRKSEINYRLIVTKNNDYGVRGLETSFTIVRNMSEWLKLWQEGQNIKPQIVCMSRSIFANAENAQPDNAFSYSICHNAFDFLSEALPSAFAGMKMKSGEEGSWTRLATIVDVSEGFDFSKFILKRFFVGDIPDYKAFLQLWFRHTDCFDRWLLVRYYVDIKHNDDYICETLAGVENYASTEFVEKIAQNLTEFESQMKVRLACLRYAMDCGVRLSDAVETLLSKRLAKLPEKLGYAATLKKYFTGISRTEMKIALEWVGKGLVAADDVKSLIPELYHYMKEGVGTSVVAPDWVEDYFAHYKKAKVSNTYTQEIAFAISERNATEAKFDSWYNGFSTTYTLLKDRTDIEVFFWIDGLGVDWIPLVRHIVEERKNQNIYLNEVMVARAKLPTKTDINKADLQRLLPDGVPLEKIGDLDALAHKTANESPYSLLDELATVKNAINEVLNRFVGKKIAIVSDHGLTYLSQLATGKNMAGVESDHHGRLAHSGTRRDSDGKEFLSLRDGAVLCALRHDSLCGKVPSGQGAHGGCTPEEVLVPVFIVSNSPTVVCWSATLLTPEVSGTNRRVKFDIRNLTATDRPHVIYNGKLYAMSHCDGTVYESDELTLDDKVTKLTLSVGETSKKYDIQVSTGVQEDDLFSF